MTEFDTPLPPTDLARRTLPITTLPKGTVLFRIHRSVREPLWFGAQDRRSSGRFDDPQRQFGVCYFGLSRRAAFAEAFLRGIPVRLLSRAFLDERSLTEVTLTRSLQVVRLHGAALSSLGTTAAVSAGPHMAARQWSRALWEHPRTPDGIRYRARHDDDEFSVAIFDRADDALQVTVSSKIRADGLWFGDVLNHYKLSLDE